MGIEIVFVMIYPIALFCLLFAFWCWRSIAKTFDQNVGAIIAAYLPLVLGFGISMAGLGVLTYIYVDAEFTALIQQGYHIEDDRPRYLPDRVAGHIVVNLIFMLPAICLVIVPMTARLAKTRRLNLHRIGMYAATGWVLCSLTGWLLTPSYSLFSTLKSMIMPTIIYALPIPVAAFLFFRRKYKVTRTVNSSCSTFKPKARGAQDDGNDHPG